MKPGSNLFLRGLLILTTTVFALIPGIAIAQNTNSGEIRGTVADASGAVIPAVTVNILNTDTGVVRELITNGDGVYDAVSILPGPYRITFTKEGFQKYVRNGVDLTVGSTTINAELAVGNTQVQIEVTAEAPAMQTESAEQSTTLEAKSMQQLPNVGQSWANFTKILPGAAGSGTGIAVNGNMPYYSNFLADGANVTLPHSANVDTMVFETVSEVQVNTSTFSAQYGIGGAVFNQISKSGTNQWHGSAYEYFQNDALNARDTFSASVPFLRYDNFGGSVGGPVIKNKLFFFFNVDKLINNGSSIITATVPTAAMRQGDFRGLPDVQIYQPNTYVAGGGRQQFPTNNLIPSNMLDPLALKFQDLYPLPNTAGSANGTQNNWTDTLQSPNPFIRYFGRLDYNLSEKNRLTMSSTYSDNPSIGPSFNTAVGGQSGDVERYQGQVSDVWTITPTTVNEFRMGFTRQGNWFTPFSINQDYPQKLGWGYNFANLPPSLSFGGPIGITTVGPATNAIYIENSFDPSDVVTMIRGRHILKFGAELLAYQDNSTPWGNVNSGTFNFSGDFTKSGPNGAGGLGYADFLLGQVQNWSASNTPIVGFRQKSTQFFVQDDFKVTPKLTLNLGLRYQIQGGWSEVANRLGDFDPNKINPATGTKGAMWYGGEDGRKNLEKNIYDIFLPRVGFAWAARDNWVARGGFGIYTYGWSVDTYSGGAEGLGTNSHGNLTSTDQLNPVFQLSQATYASLPYVQASTVPDSFNGQSPTYYPYKTPVAKNYQWSFSLEHQFAGMVAQAAYVGSHGANLSFPINYNQIPGNLLAQAAANPTTAQSLRPFSQFQDINGNLFDAISNYNSLQLSLTKRFSHGLQFDVNYTWSKMLDEQDSSGWGSRDGGQVYQSSYNPRLNYALSNFDIPNMFKGDVVYDLPIGKGRRFLSNNAIADAVVGGWQLSTTYVLESGRPFTPIFGGPNSTNAFGGNLFPNIIGDPSVSHQSTGQWFNTCTIGLDGALTPAGCSNPAWAVPAPGTFGTAGRNILRGPGIIDVDFSIGKNFRIPLPRETGNLQLRFDALNVLNHANYDIPNGNVGTTGAGIITSTTNNYSTTNNSFGARILQLGARFSF
jgi:hypothetical protein